MSAHPIDFTIQSSVFSTSEFRKIFDEQTRFQRWLDIEKALALSQAELGIIPEDAAAAISAKASLEHIDLEAVREEYKISRNSLLPLLKAFRNACGKAGEYIHFGATTQDILDTCQVLELKDSFLLLYRDIKNLEQILVDLTEKYRSTPMIGRTHGQHALPITFGLITATWASEIRRHLERIKSLAPRILGGQLGGAVGNMAALGASGPEVARAMMKRLGLYWMPPAWHTSRDNMAETAAFLAILATTAEKIATEVIQLGKTEIAELSETMPLKSESSSTMPHKKNPVFSQRVSVLARHVRALSGTVIEGMVHEHERDPRALWSEWLAMPQISIYAGTALNYLLQILSGLSVDTDRMNKNLLAHKAAVSSEWLFFKLREFMGAAPAREKINELLASETDRNQTIIETIKTDAQLSHYFDEDDLNLLDNPGRNTGQSIQLIDIILKSIRDQQQKDPEEL